MSANWGPGAVILGRYRLDSILGRGGMGSVWRAEHLQLRSPVAIKLLDHAISQNHQMLARFMHEAQAAARLRSPHVVQIFDFGVEQGSAFIAMELLRGESLAARLARRKQLPAEEAIGFLSQVLRAIAKAHESGIVHRDLKPDNIFICADEPEFVKVLDFGVAKVMAGELTAVGTAPGVMIGTPYYMSPEQMRAKDVDARSDLWSIAVIAYECLVGVRPFTGDELGELVIAICTGSAPVPSQNANVPPGFDAWFAKAIQRDRELRFGSAREMAEQLIKLSPGSNTLRSQFPTWRNPAAIASTAPHPKAAPSRAPGADQLELTTGQRAATSLDHARAPRSAAHYALIAVALLIVAGVGTFLVSAASGLKAAIPQEAAAAALTATVPVVAAATPAAPIASAALVPPVPSASAGSVAASSVPARSAQPEPLGASKSRALLAPKRMAVPSAASAANDLDLTGHQHRK